MTFLESINRIFRINGLIRGDTDPVTSFSQTQHGSSMQVAQIAIQDELIDLAADRMVDYERTEGTISLVDATRVYDLPANFRAFEFPWFIDANTKKIGEYPGGLRKLELDDPLYKTAAGDPLYWYWESTTSKKVGFWPLPNGDSTLTYRYEKSILVTVASDTLPFHTSEEDYAFCMMAARRFKFLFEDVSNANDVQQILDNDTSYKRSRATLYTLMRGQPAGTSWGTVYQ
jgi:hypothetical protein